MYNGVSSLQDQRLSGSIPPVLHISGRGMPMVAALESFHQGTATEEDNISSRQWLCRNGTGCFVDELEASCCVSVQPSRVP